jgi:integrase/recombinase XerC
VLHKFADGPVMIAELQPDDVRQFIAQQLDLRSTTSNATAVTSALRAYYRYRTTCGDRMHGLVGVIAKPARWSLGSLPRGLSDAETSRLLSSFVDSLPAPRRGYAIVRCALDMGLRSSEVAKLQLVAEVSRRGELILESATPAQRRVLFATAIREDEETSTDSFIRFAGFKTTARWAQRCVPF